ncbi:hypothetical protein MRX96_004531 [Rhipicephalus microplus]
MATNIRVSRALTQDIFDRLVYRTTHTRRAATSTLSEELVRGSAASSSKTQQECTSTPTNSCCQQASERIVGCCVGVQVKSPDVASDNLLRHTETVHKVHGGCRRFVGVLRKRVGCLIASHSHVFHEHAIFDVPAHIDYILREAKRKDLLYIGMSQGTLTFFTMLAEKPWYNDRIKAFAGLAPFYKLGHLKVPPLAAFSPYAEAPLRLAHAAGSYEVLPQGMPIAGFVRHFCGYATRGICSLLADNFANFGSRYINESRIPVYLCHLPAGTSMKNIIHFDQLVKSQKFQKFDYGPFYNNDYYGKRSVPEYELSNVKTDLGIFWSAGDEFVPPEDVRELLKSLQGNVKINHYIDDPFYTHIHFLVSTTNGVYLHKELLAFLRRYDDKGELCPAA